MSLRGWHKKHKRRLNKPGLRWNKSNNKMRNKKELR
jgi:hypothetical protein